jgi:hypothetical protein
MPLQPCIECGHGVSDSARSCPACSTKNPFGVFCELCRGKLRPSEGLTCIRSYYSDGVVNQDVYAHHGCVTALFTAPESLSCRDCGLSVREIPVDTDAVSLWRTYLQVNCSSCGATDLLFAGPRITRCGWGCRAPRYSFQEPPKGLGHGHPTAAAPSTSKAGCVGLLAALALCASGLIGRSAIAWGTREDPTARHQKRAVFSIRFKEAANSALHRTWSRKLLHRECATISRAAPSR